MRLLCVVFLIVLVPGGASSVAEPPDIHDVVEAQQETVVKLFGAGVGNLDSYGSGVLISEQGHVATVWNHLINTGFLTAVVADGRRYTVQVVGTSLEHDLAILKLNSDDDETFSFVDWKASDEALTGETVLAFSNVYHVATGNEPVSVVHGVIAGKSLLKAGFGRWQFPISTPVYILDAVTNNSGAAGGLLTSQDGRPLGLLGREIRHRDTDMWVNYAVPFTTLQPAITTMLAGRRVQPSAATGDDRKMLSDRVLTSAFGLTLLPGVLKRTPAYVDRVIPDSPAAAAGLQRGDLVLMVNEDVIQSVNDLRASLAGFRRGQRVTLTLNRNNSLQVTELRIP
ncbi:MAG: trypsin-like peptidase domain-containing protein [Fuerstiella sp.]